jgi:Ca2+-binding EF-hand superfamily protein
MPLSDLQIRKLTAAFEAFDVNENGLAERADHLAIIDRACAVRGYAAGTPQHAELHAKLWPIWDMLERYADTDADKAVNLESWLKYFEVVIHGPADGMTAAVTAGVGNIVDMVDLDGDGRLDLGEYRALLRVYGIDEGHATGTFPRLDLDGDGFISRVELLELVRQWFTSSDPTAPGNQLWGPI